METHNVGFCSHGNFDALKLKLKQLMNEPKLLRTMSENAVKFAEETFTSQTILDEYLKLFERKNS
jgi:glycosyltransferase involved in cell wall biosynthesis